MKKQNSNQIKLSMQTVKLRKKIAIEPKYLDSKLKTHIWNHLVSLFKNNCTQKYGYILDVHRKVEILTNEVIHNGILSVEIATLVDTLIPEKDQILKGTVCMIFEDGILCTETATGTKLKILVPSHNIPTFLYDKEEKAFVSKKKKIREGDEIEVKIDLIRYEDKEFNCIGFLNNGF